MSLINTDLLRGPGTAEGRRPAAWLRAAAWDPGPVLGFQQRVETRGPHLL